MTIQYLLPIIVPLISYLGGYALGRYHRRIEDRKFAALGNYVQGNSNAVIQSDRKAVRNDR